VATPDRALRSALHNQPAVGETQRAGVPHAHAEHSVSDSPSDALSLTERNRQRIAERWGKPIEEPAGEPLLDDVDENAWRVLLRGFTVHFHIYRDPIPSIRAVRADYKNGLEDVRQQSASAVAVYRLFGLPGQAWATTFRFLAVQGDRPGRFAGFLFIVVLLAGSLAWAILT
jgi:hypothetical protein